jgi:hypothetical protein
LEIGSMHYESSNAIARAMDEMYKDGFGVIDSFDIRRGGYTGETQYVPKSKRIRARYWLPHHNEYDDWKYKVIDHWKKGGINVDVMLVIDSIDIDELRAFVNERVERCGSLQKHRICNGRHARRGVSVGRVARAHGACDGSSVVSKYGACEF